MELAKSHTGCYYMFMSSHIRKEPSGEHVAIAVDLFKLMGEPTRLKILWALLHGEHAVGELAEDVDVKPAVVSQHLAKLRTSHMVSVRREGTKMFYRAENDHVMNLIARAFSQADHIKSGIHT